VNRDFLQPFTMNLRIEVQGSRRHCNRWRLDGRSVLVAEADLHTLREGSRAALGQHQPALDMLQLGGGLQPFWAGFAGRDLFDGTNIRDVA
jgi:hypothetical protein